MTDSYRQVLPELELSIERFTAAVPHDGGWYLLRAGEQLGRYRTLSKAQDAWREKIRETGWKRQRRPVEPGEIQRREQKERWARNRAG